jgi:hypothetical protein
MCLHPTHSLVVVADEHKCACYQAVEHGTQVHHEEEGAQVPGGNRDTSHVINAP